METPVTIHRKNSYPVAFKNCAIGVTFECNGNLWTKRTSKTATGIWPAILPVWAYFRQVEIVYIHRES